VLSVVLVILLLFGSNCSAAITLPCLPLFLLLFVALPLIAALFTDLCCAVVALFVVRSAFCCLRAALFVRQLLRVVAFVVVVPVRLFL